MANHPVSMHELAATYPGQANMATQNANAGGNPITSFFGMPNNPADVQHLASDSTQYRNFQEWRAYAGQSNPYIKEIITMQIFSEDAFYTSPKYGLPIRNMNQVIYRISELEMDNVVVPDEPEEGVAPVIRTRLHERQVQAKRKGIMLELEHGFAHTPQGHLHYQRETQVVANSILLTIFLDVIYNLMSCKPRQLRWAREHNKLEMDPVQVCRDQAAEAFIFQKSKEAAINFLYKKNKVFKMRNNVDPNALYMPSGCEPYFNGAMNDPDLDVGFSGERAYDRRMADQYKNPGTSAGLKICVVNIADPRTSGGFDLDPLVRNRVFGSYNAMIDPYTHDYELFVGKDNSILSKTAWRDCKINDFGADNMTKITMVAAIENCLLFEPRLFSPKGVEILDDEDNDSKGLLVNNGEGVFGFDGKKEASELTFGDIPLKYFDPNVISILKATKGKDNAVYNANGAGAAHISARGNISFLQVGGSVTRQDEVNLHEANQLLLEEPTLGHYNNVYEKVLGSDTHDANKFAAYVNTNAKDPVNAQVNVSGPLADIADLKVTAKRYNNTLKTMSEEVPVVESTSFEPEFHETRTLLQRGGDVTVSVGDGNVATVNAEELRGAKDIGIEHLQSTLSERGMSPGSIDIVSNSFSQADGIIDMAKKISASGDVDAIREIKSHFNDLGLSVGAYVSDYQKHRAGTTSDLTLVKELGDDSKFCAQPISRQALLFRAKHNLYIPFNFLLIRPWQACQTGSGILLKGGEETGFVGVGNKDAKVGFGVTSKIWTVHYTFNEQAVVWNHLNVYPMDDLFFVKYLEGRGKVFYDHESIEHQAEDKHLLREGRPDIICHMVSQTWEPADVFDIRGKVEMIGQKSLEDENENSYENAKALSSILQLTDQPDAPRWDTSTRHLNTRVHLDHTVLYNPVARKFNYIIINRGHLGRNVYGGMRSDLENGKVLMEKQYLDGDN